MSYRRQKRWWNAYILFYEQVNEVPTTDEDTPIIKTMQDLTIGEWLTITPVLTVIHARYCELHLQSHSGNFYFWLSWNEIRHWSRVSCWLCHDTSSPLLAAEHSLCTARWFGIIQQDFGSFKWAWKLGCFLCTSVHSALETFATIALHKSTYTIPYHVVSSDNDRWSLWVRPVILHYIEVLGCVSLLSDASFCFTVSLHHHLMVCSSAALYESADTNMLPVAWWWPLHFNYSN